MNSKSGFYHWESQVELLAAHPEETAIYYEWLLRLEAGARPGEALQQVGVSAVLPAAGERPGWIPVFMVDHIDEAVAGLPTGHWRRTDDPARPGLTTIIDEQGTVVRLRERSTRERVSEAGRVNFDCSSSNVSATSHFYSRLLGLEAVEVIDDTYAMHLLSDGTGVVAGVFTLSGVAQSNRESFWLSYFEVDSVEESVTRAVQSGSRVRIPPTDSPFNRYAVLDDPWGQLYGFSAMFSQDRLAGVPVLDPATGEPGRYADVVLKDS